MNTLTSTLAITVASVHTPPHEGDFDQMVGIALVELIEFEPGQFVGRLACRTLSADEGQETLLAWLADHLPTHVRTIGWGLADDIVPRLLAAADKAPSNVAADVIDALASTLSIDAVDLADEPVHAMDDDLATACANNLVPCISMSPGGLLGEWAVGHVAPIAEMLLTNAIASWRLWAQRAAVDPDIAEKISSDLLWRMQVRLADGDASDIDLHVSVSRQSHARLSD
jgi:hypothetical protein